MMVLNFFMGFIIVVVSIIMILVLGWLGEKTIFDNDDNDYFITFLNGWCMLIMVILASTIIVGIYGLGELAIGLINVIKYE
jgi:hypothetical protein